MADTRIPEMQKTELRPGKCAVWLIVWFCVISLAADALAPTLNRISYPQIRDLLVLCLYPVGAFHAARFARTRLLFTLYGAVASVPFWLIYLCDRSPFWWSDSVIAGKTSLACIVTALLVGTCRLAARVRWRWDPRSRFPAGHCQACGYDLTGNVSGVCPECGTNVAPC